METPCSDRSAPERVPLIGIPTPADFIKARGSIDRSPDAAYMAATDPMPHTKHTPLASREAPIHGPREMPNALAATDASPAS